MLILTLTLTLIWIGLECGLECGMECGLEYGLEYGFHISSSSPVFFRRVVVHQFNSPFLFEFCRFGNCIVYFRLDFDFGYRFGKTILRAISSPSSLVISNNSGFGRIPNNSSLLKSSLKCGRSKTIRKR